MSKIKKEYIELLKKHEADGARITRAYIQETLQVPEWTARTYSTILNNWDLLEEMLSDEEIIDQNVKLAGSKQKYMDLNRIERKAFRENVRKLNVIEELNKTLIEGLEKIDLEVPLPVNPDIQFENNVAIIQLSDTHFNELVDLESNKYDFKVAAKRLQKFAHEAKMLCNAFGVESVLIAMTGDLINSDRRLDEKMAMASNRTMATLLAAQLLEYFILDIAKECKVTVTYVAGNESRVNPEFGFVDLIASDNYDTMIFNILAKVFKKIKKTNVTFIQPKNVVESIVSINNKNILLLHGTTIGQSSQQKIQQIIGKYAAKGIRIHYVIFGHIHFAEITDLYARSGSLVGSNAYSESALNLISHPSQNVHLIFKNGQINNMRHELSRVDGYEGYPIQDELATYNAKSVDKLNPGVEIVRVVV